MTASDARVTDVSAAPARKKGVKPHTGRRGLPPATQESKRLAAAILEVLAGVRTPTAAAAALGISVPRYYQLEQRAVGGLVSACEPRPLGPKMSVERKVAALEKELRRWQQECARQQALVRTAQRAIGLTAPPAPKLPEKAAGEKSRRRRPMVRALRAAAALRSDSSGLNAPPAVENQSHAGVPGGGGTEGASRGGSTP
jgi:hypothetical protein